MRSPPGKSGKKYMRINHNKMERNPCKIDVPENLNQAIGLIRFLNGLHRDVKGERGRME